ncbi:MAG: glutathione S-transferase, partial [Bradymonadia bacterium]
MPKWRYWGWPCSPFSVKTLSYMRFKGLDFRAELPHLGHMFAQIRATVGRVVLPVVIMPDKTMLQDSSAIIDHIEAIKPSPPAWPQTPLQRFVAHLIELYADEWVVILAMHTRWNLANDDFIVADFGECAAPWLPRIGQRPVGRRLALKMSSYLPKMGVEAATVPAIEAWGVELLDALELHLQSHRFLLGDAPCVGDFALMGPLHAHLERDPASSSMIKSRPAIVTWIARTRAGEAGTALLADDEVPATLDAVLRRCFSDQMPFLAETAAALTEWREANPEPVIVPRSMGRAPFSLGAAVGGRSRITYSLWMLQRALDAYDAAPDQSV